MILFHSIILRMKVQPYRYWFVFGAMSLLFVKWGIELFVWESDGKFISSSEDDGAPYKPPLILMWTSIFRRRTVKATEKFLPADQAALEGCEVTFDRGRIKETNALVFHFYRGDLILKDIPNGVRDGKQVWVLMGQESPLNSPKGMLENLNNTFNWTMTYRLDSEVEHVYGKKVEIDPIQGEHSEEEHVKIDRIVKKKQKLAVGVISKCTTFSKREKLVDQLKALIPVDIFGKCGKPLKVRHDLSSAENQFWEGLGSIYKFYLAFENSICVDYITEKFWRALRHGMVPVVYGGGNYSLVGPPNSFIDAREFPNVTMLANYLLMLDRDLEQYRKFFQWRKRFRIVDDEGIGIRSLCRKLKEFKKSKHMGNAGTRIYKDLKGWWDNNLEVDGSPSPNHKGSCSNPEYSS